MITFREVRFCRDSGFIRCDVCLGSLSPFRLERDAWKFVDNKIVVHTPEGSLVGVRVSFVYRLLVRVCVCRCVYARVSVCVCYKIRCVSVSVSPASFEIATSNVHREDRRLVCFTLKSDSR